MPDFLVINIQTEQVNLVHGWKKPWHGSHLPVGTTVMPFLHTETGEEWPVCEMEDIETTVGAHEVPNVVNQSVHIMLIFSEADILKLKGHELEVEEMLNREGWQIE